MAPSSTSTHKNSSNGGSKFGKSQYPVTFDLNGDSNSHGASVYFEDIPQLVPNSGQAIVDHGDFKNAHVNTTDSPSPTVIVRGEEVGIVVFVLLLWVGAIALFFNRWGKIRMLEPYQPKFCETHRPSCPIADVPPIPHFPRSMSKFNISTEGSPHFAKCTYNYHPVSLGGGGYSGGASSTLMTSVMTSTPFPSTSSNITSNPTAFQIHRPRQNSVFTSPMSLNGYVKNTSRKTKSAVDLSNLILTEEFVENVRRNSKNSITHV